MIPFFERENVAAGDLLVVILGQPMPIIVEDGNARGNLSACDIYVGNVEGRRSGRTNERIRGGRGAKCFGDCGLQRFGISCLRDEVK